VEKARIEKWDGSIDLLHGRQWPEGEPAPADARSGGRWKFSDEITRNSDLGRANKWSAPKMARSFHYHRSIPCHFMPHDFLRET